MRRVIDRFAGHQKGVVTRAQAECGVTIDTIKGHLRARRWRAVFRGVYATFSGPLPRSSLLWAAVLRAGPEAMLSHETAAELIGLTEPGAPIHVTVPAGRAPEAIPGVVIHRSVRTVLSRHPTRTPPQTRTEETIVDLTQTARRLEDALGWLARSVGARVTTAPRLLSAVECRSRLRWRRVLVAALRDVAAGCHSLLELVYLRDVERAHGLPRADRQVLRVAGGAHRYDDVCYLRYHAVVELDGRVGHPAEQRWRDMRRDNASVVDGNRVLRYGHHDVTQSPCQVAAQVAPVLQLGGWRGRPKRCRRPDCVIVGTIA